METKIQYQRCQRCNRILKNDLAKERGYGNYCWKIHIIELQKSKKHGLDSYLFPENK